MSRILSIPKSAAGSKPIHRATAVTKKLYRSLDDSRTVTRLVRHLPAGLYITNSEGDILDANPACLEILGVTSLEELEGVSAEELFLDPEDRDRELDLLEDSGSLRQHELRIRGLDGEERTVIDTCYSVQDPGTGETLLHGILVDISERKELEERLRHLSYRDPLTGLYNRRYLKVLDERLGDDGLWAVIVVDVDHFKRYNDRYGHDAGDDVLVRVGRFLESNVSSEDAVLRIGGDEFLVVVIGESARNVDRIASRLRAEARPSPVPLTVGASVRRDHEKIERTISRADQRLIETRTEERR